MSPAEADAAMAERGFRRDALWSRGLARSDAWIHI